MLTQAQKHRRFVKISINQYYQNGDFNNAIKYALKVLDIQEKSIGKNHISLTLGNLGVYYLFASKYEKALDLFRGCSIIVNEY